MSDNKNIQKITVTIIREIWANEEGSFIVYLAGYYNKKGDYDEITVNCSGFELRPGKTTLVGQFRKYQGKDSFKADYEEFDANSYEGKYNLLCSIDGIKDATARKILEAIKDESLEIFYNDDLPKIKGIGKKTIEKIFKGLNFLKSNKNLKELISLLGNTIGVQRIHKLNDILTENKTSVQEFKSDPYTILCDKIGVQFKKVDWLAQEKWGCDKYLRSRLLLLSEKVVNAITGFGHTYTSLEEFNNKISSMNLNANNINCLLKSEDSKVVLLDNDNIQTMELNNSELQIPELLKGFEVFETISKYEVDNIDSLIKEYEVKNNIILHIGQKNAIKDSILHNVSILTGGAGTGKSTIVKAIIYVLDKINNTKLLTASTGKASRRLSETTDNQAHTCHRFYFQEESRSVIGGTLEWDSNLPMTMIIDEASMIDTTLMYKILTWMVKSRNSFNRLILVGDPGQLPSVGPGSVLNDLIESGCIKVNELTNTFRQGTDSNIIKIANKVRFNETFEPIKEKDFFVNCPKDLNGYIIRCWLHQYKLFENIDDLYDNLQICTSSRKRANEINSIIQKEMKHVKFKIGKNYEAEFGIGDKVMCTKNDYINDIYNGEFGRVTSLSYRTKQLLPDEEDLIIDTPEKLSILLKSNQYIKNCKFKVYYKGLNKTITYDLAIDEVSNFSLAYCSTIHKLQGSEFQIVICDLSEFNMITDSRLLYTAITRAKKQFILLSDELSTICKVVRNRLSSKRNTLLQKRLKETFNNNKVNQKQIN